MATKFKNGIDADSNIIKNVATPIADDDAVNKAYADSLSTNWHSAVNRATLAVLPNSPTYHPSGADNFTPYIDQSNGYGVGAYLESSSNARLVVDSHNAVVGDRFLVKNQTDARQNGIYYVATVADQGTTAGGGTHWKLTRATDDDNHIAGQVRQGDAVIVINGSGGSGYAGQSFIMTATGSNTDGTIKIGTDNITWTAFSGVIPTLANANTVLAGDSTGSATNAPTFRKVVLGDLDISSASSASPAGIRLNNIGAPDAAVSFSSQNITSAGTIAGTTITASGASITIGTASTTTGTVVLKNSTSTGNTTLTPDNTSATSYTLTIPAATDTLVGKATTDTLTNKTLTSAKLTSTAGSGPNPVTITSTQTTSGQTITFPEAASGATVAYTTGTQINGTSITLGQNNTGFKTSTTNSLGLTSGGGLTFNSSNTSFDGGTSGVTIGIDTAKVPTISTATAVTFTGTTGTSPNITIPNAATATMARTDAGQTFTGVQTFTSPNISGTSTTITNVGTFALRDTSAAFDVTIAATSSTALTAGRTLTIDLANAARTLKLDANITASTLLTTSSTSSALTSFGTSPTLTTPTIGAATATSINKVAITAPATGSTLTIADGKTLTANNSIQLNGTDSTTMTFPSTSATIARTDAGQTFTGANTFSSTITGSVSGNAGTVTNGVYTTDVGSVTSNMISDATIVNGDISSSANIAPTKVQQASVMLTPSVAQTVPNASQTNLALDTVTNYGSYSGILAGTAGTYSSGTHSATGKITASVACAVSASGFILWTNTTTNIRALIIRRYNSSNTLLEAIPVSQIPQGAAFTATAGTVNFVMNANDYITLTGYQNSGGVLGYSTTNTSAFLRVTVLGGGA